MRVGPMMLYRIAGLSIDNVGRERTRATQGRLHFWSSCVPFVRAIDSSFVRPRSFWLRYREEPVREATYVSQKTRPFLLRYRPVYGIIFLVFSLPLARYMPGGGIARINDRIRDVLFLAYTARREQKAPRVTSKTYRTTETILFSGLTASACCILCRAASLMTG